MDTLLTIAIPTYNRAQLLDQQLAWLSGAIQGLETQCEIIISDNCSTDHTPEIIQKWATVLEMAALKVVRQDHNIGAVRNIADCINTASSRHVWTISDDDKINDDTISYVLTALKEYPELALLVLNFSSHEVKTGRLRYEHCFQVENDDVNPNGKAVFENCLQGEDPGGIALTTALIYRTDLAQRALQTWSSGLDNLAVQMYWTGYCGLPWRR